MMSRLTFMCDYACTYLYVCDCIEQKSESIPSCGKRWCMRLGTGPRKLIGGEAHSHICGVAAETGELRMRFRCSISFVHISSLLRLDFYLH